MHSFLLGNFRNRRRGSDPLAWKKSLLGTARSRSAHHFLSLTHTSPSGTQRNPEWRHCPNSQHMSLQGSPSKLRARSRLPPRSKFLPGRAYIVQEHHFPSSLHKSPPGQGVHSASVSVPVIAKVPAGHGCAPCAQGAIRSGRTSRRTSVVVRGHERGPSTRGLVKAPQLPRAKLSLLRKPSSRWQ